LRYEETWQVEGALQLEPSLRATVPRGPTFRADGQDRASYALWTDSGPATVSLEYSDGDLRASAVGSGAAEALAAVPRTVGLDDDPSLFDAGSGLVREMHRRYHGLRFGATGRVFDALLPAIIGQRVTTDEARRSYRKLVRMTGEPAPGDGGLILPPRPEAVLRLRQAEFHSLGIETARARVIMEAARRSSRLEEISTMARAEAQRRLVALPGVGPWTSARVMASAWGDRDAVPLGDLHMPNIVAWALAGEPRGTDERMLELLEPFRPNRRRAVLLIKRSGIHAPRYGPRAPKSVIARGGY
jgi:3-methyladenine DNA glycosylase/8-oxoguanine DNA glycosylase